MTESIATVLARTALARTALARTALAGTVPGRTAAVGLRPASSLLSGVSSGDLLHVVASVIGAVVVVAIVGAVAVRLLARRSVGLQVALVAAVCVITAMITTGEIAG
jgi:uncharacterized membrane protein YeaQ/YmgE (transglycosylase-associated protein family)